MPTLAAELIPTRQEFLHIGSAGKALFYSLVAISLAIMLWQIAARLKLWMQGKPIDERPKGWRYWIPKHTELSRWLASIWTYILGQRKVRSSRRRSGAPMHLLIFYGF